MSNTKLDPNPFKQAIKDRSEGVMVCKATIDNLLALGAALHDAAKELAALQPELEALQVEIQNHLDNVENQA